MATPSLVVALWMGVTLTAADDARRSVWINLNELDAAAYQELKAHELEGRCVVRLIQEGFSVVGSRESADIEIRLRSTSNRLLIETEIDTDYVKREVVRGGEALSEFHLEVAQNVADLSRQAGRSLTAVKVAAALAPAINPPPHVEHRTERRFRIRAGADVVWRQAPVDLGVRVSLQAPIDLGFSLHVAVHLIHVSTPSIRVYEPRLLAGIGYTVQLSRAFALEPAVFAGVELHLFELADPSLSQSQGFRSDFSGLIALPLVWTPFEALSIEIRVAGGLNSRSRSHKVGATTLYSRGAARVEAGVGVGVQF